jgi:hypothetical protein
VGAIRQETPHAGESVDAYRPPMSQLPTAAPEPGLSPDTPPPFPTNSGGMNHGPISDPHLR